MSEKLGSGGKEYQARFRSLMFNLRDPKNPDLVRAIVLGQVHVTDLARIPRGAVARQTWT